MRKSRRCAVALALVGVLALLLCRLLAPVVRVALGDTGAIYPAGQIAADLARDPQQWVGRTIRVRGVPRRYDLVCVADISCPRIADTGLLLLDPSAALASARQYVPVVLGRPDPWLSRLRTLPFVGALVPRPQQFSAQRAGVFRLRLQTGPCLYHPEWRCYEGMLLDAAPGP